VDLLEACTGSLPFPKEGAQIVFYSGTAAQTSSSPRSIYYYVAVPHAAQTDRLE
jgi:hypothetical protein